MKFSYAIGNPPYQEDKNSNMIQLWPDFIYETRKISNKTCLIHPGRFVNPEQKMKKVADDMIACNLKTFNLFPEGKEVFEGTNIAGGIAITYYEDEFIGDINGYVKGNYSGVYKSNMPFFIGYKGEVYNKVFNNIQTNMLQYVLGTGYTCKCGYKKGINTDKLHDTDNGMINPIRIRCSKIKANGGANRWDWFFIEKADLIDPAPEVFLDKLAVGNIGPTKVDKQWGVCGIDILDSKTIMDGCYFIIPKNNTEKERELIYSLICTKTARYLMTILQKSIHVKGFEYIPDYLELAKLLPEDQLFTDEWFYKTFNFSKECINEIEYKIRDYSDRLNNLKNKEA